MAFEAIRSEVARLGRLPHDLARMVAEYARDDTLLAAEVIGRNRPKKYTFTLNGRAHGIEFEHVVNHARQPIRIPWGGSKFYSIRIYVYDVYSCHVVMSQLMDYDDIVRAIKVGPASWTTDGPWGATLARLHAEIERIWSGPSMLKKS